MDIKDRIENNHKHHPPQTTEREEAHAKVRELTRVVGLELVDLCPESRELSIALTKLEEVMMWANASLARNEK